MGYASHLQTVTFIRTVSRIYIGHNVDTDFSHPLTFISE